MPLPLAHSVACISAYLVFKGEASEGSHEKNLYLLGLSLVCANLPDLDFVPGILTGEPSKFHPSLSHSILICVVIALTIYFLINKKLEGIARKSVLGCIVISLLSHPILDYFTPITKQFSGYLLFWPFDLRPHISSFPLFQNVHRVDDSVYLFFTSLINIHNFRAIVVELLFSGMLLSLIMMTKRRTVPNRTIWSLILLFLCSMVYYFIQIRPELL